MYKQHSHICSWTSISCNWEGKFLLFCVITNHATPAKETFEEWVSNALKCVIPKYIITIIIVSVIIIIIIIIKYIAYSQVHGRMEDNVYLLWFYYYY